MTELNYDYLKKVGKRISDLREKKDITQDELGNALGIPRSTLAKYETGLQDFKSETIVQMCDYFGVSADYLLRGASAQALNVHRKTGLTDAALKTLTDEKNVSETFFDGNGRIDMVNELLADKDFFYLLEEFVHFRREWREITAADDGDRNAQDGAEFLRWKYTRQVDKYIDKLLEG
jgi:transcriptional regulator with XRE-family HTH domain